MKIIHCRSWDDFPSNVRITDTISVEALIHKTIICFSLAKGKEGLHRVGRKRTLVQYLKDDEKHEERQKMSEKETICAQVPGAVY